MMAVRSRRVYLRAALVVVALLVVAGVALVALRPSTAQTHGDQATTPTAGAVPGNPGSPPAAGASTPDAPSVSPAQPSASNSATSTNTKASASISATNTRPSAGTGTAAAPTDTSAVAALGQSLVDAISVGDKAALSRLLCGPLAAEMNAQPVQPDPTVFDHVADVSVAPEGDSGTVTVYAYKEQRGPPARPMKFAVRKTGAGWQACSVVGG